MAETDDTGGLRERKRKETLQRITDAGLKLFGRDGYEKTTVDEIAAEAGISRRTFFHYFASKDEILLSMQAGLGDSLVDAMQAIGGNLSPLAVMREAMLTLASAFEPEEMRRIDKIMLSSESVQTRKQAGYLRDEAKLFAALKERWPEEPPFQLRLVAMLSIGVTRMSLEAWREEGGERPVVDVTREIFDSLAALQARR